MKDEEIVLTILRKLKHWATRDFIWQIAIEDNFAPIGSLSRQDVSITLENLFENGMVENRLFKSRSFWRMVRES